MTGLNDKEFKDFNDIVQNTLNSLIACADKHNIDRDSFVKYFSAIFSAMADVSTFTNYTCTSKKRGSNYYNEIRSEAIREFAKKIKNIYSVHDGLHSTIDTLVKEMINDT